MDPYTPEPVESTEPQGFHAVMRFLRVVNRHRLILIGCVAAAAFLAIVRFNRLPKQYSASTRLLVTEKVSASANNHRSRTSPVSSFKQLLLSDDVLEAAIVEMVNIVRDADDIQMPPEFRLQKESTAWPRVMRSMLSVVDDTKEQTLQISCESVEPEGTVVVLTALRAASEQYMADYQKNISEELRKELTNQRERVEEKLKEKEDELLRSRKACGDLTLTENKDELHPVAQRVSTLNVQLTTVRNRGLELASTLASAQQQKAAGADLTSSIQSLGAIVGEKFVEDIPGTEGMSRATIDELTTELHALESELTTLRPHYGSRHFEIIKRQSEINEKRAQIGQAKAERRQKLLTGVRGPQIGEWLINKIQSQLWATKQYENALKLEYDQAKDEAEELSGKLASIQNTERETDTLRNLHQSLLSQLSSIPVDTGSGGFRVATLNTPTVPRNASYPILSSIMSMFCFIGAALALGIIYVLDLMDDRLRSPEEVREQLGLPVLAVLRKLPEEEVEQAKIYVHGFPQTVHAESFRTLKTSLTMASVDTKCLAVTSTEASEGKTTTTVNLAASYAQTGVRTLLIDADMRRPGLSRLLEIRGQGGLSEVLRSESDIGTMCKERIVSTDVPLLDVLPCGPRILNAGMLLSMPTLADLLDWAVAEYDQVIVDCPPTLPVSDAAIVGRYVDSMLFLMNPDKTHRRSVVRAVDQLRSLGLKIAGVVANTSLSDEKSGYGYQYGYGYGYGGEYTYGHEDEDFVSDNESDSSDGLTDGDWEKAA